MMSESTNFTSQDEAQLRKKLEKRFKKRQDLIIHAGIYALVNIPLLLWVLFGFSNGRGGTSFPWPLIIVLGWSAGILGHFISYYYQYGSGAQKREDAIKRELDHYRENRAYEKPKNDERYHLELSEDGEIEEVYDDSASSQKRSR